MLRSSAAAVAPPTRWARAEQDGIVSSQVQAAAALEDGRAPRVADHELREHALERAARQRDAQPRDRVVGGRIIGHDNPAGAAPWGAPAVTLWKL